MSCWQLLHVTPSAIPCGLVLDDGGSFHYFFKFGVWRRVEVAPKSSYRVAHHRDTIAPSVPSFEQKELQGQNRESCYFPQAGAATDHQTIYASSISLRSREGSTGADALRNTLDLAHLADELGYARYWVAEHHGTPMLACASREVMIASIGSTTRRMRIGSGGVMLPHYSPFKVAETFSILSALSPDRVDLGIGRAPRTDPATAFALAKPGPGCR